MIENIKEVMKIHPRDSEFSKQSQNSQVLDEVETFELKYEEKLSKRQNVMDGGEPREQSGNSQKKNCVKITEHEDVKEITLPLKPKQLQELQNNDTYCRDIAKKLDKEVELQKIFIKESYILFIKWDLQEKQKQCR